MSTESARAVVAGVQRALDRRDLDGLIRCFAQDGVLIGTASYNNGGLIPVYLGRVLDQPGALRWDLDRYDIVLDEAPVLAFSASGEASYTEDGNEERSPFRLSIVAVDDGRSWRILQFHGSVPE